MDSSRLRPRFMFAALPQCSLGPCRVLTEVTSGSDPSPDERVRGIAALPHVCSCIAVEPRRSVAQLPVFALLTRHVGLMYLLGAAHCFLGATSKSIAARPHGCREHLGCPLPPYFGLTPIACCSTSCLAESCAAQVPVMNFIFNVSNKEPHHRQERRGFDDSLDPAAAFQSPSKPTTFLPVFFWYCHAVLVQLEPRPRSSCSLHWVQFRKASTRGVSSLTTTGLAQFSIPVGWRVGVFGFGPVLLWLLIKSDSLHRCVPKTKILVSWLQFLYHQRQHPLAHPTALIPPTFSLQRTAMCSGFHSGWTICGNARVSSKASLNLVGRFLNFDMELPVAARKNENNLLATFLRRRNEDLTRIVFLPWTKLICVSSPRCVYMCVKRCPPPSPPNTKCVYMCHQMRLYVCHQMRLLNPQRSSLRSLTFCSLRSRFFQQSKLEFLSKSCFEC